jgi:hypothetical protein
MESSKCLNSKGKAAGLKECHVSIKVFLDISTDFDTVRGTYA